MRFPCRELNEFETLLRNTARHESTRGSIRQRQAMNLGVSVSGDNILLRSTNKDK